ncbi:methionine adenosyltransferase [Ewingella americana]|uniref:Methionine adenosyltransferase n=1 Tax=Ewingella americana TaxID=41202 RepID=A0A502GF14_9GAMM|nr:methionine adenosyltransferase [Ewingella americana]TPG59880.1 methionine adenosyltransferase [Ewingella americana]
MTQTSNNSSFTGKGSQFIQLTSESVSSGHPDKICDQISDAIVDAHLSVDPEARVACETLVKDNSVVLAGEITSKAKLTNDDYRAIARGVIKRIGYDSDKLGFNASTFSLINLLGQQSPDINQGVDRKSKDEQGAGDQGIMFGFATNETPEFMPLPLLLSHRLLQRLELIRNDMESTGDLRLRPDAKSQVTIDYCESDLTFAGVNTVLISTQHSEDITQEELRELLIEKVIFPVLCEHQVLQHNHTDDLELIKILVNPTGNFVIGGPVGDSGLTGRKIAVDQYAGFCPIGGGAYSGKDASKVDRSASYLCRYVAKNIVAAGLADQCTIHVSYAIGVAEPTSVQLECKGTEKVALHIIVAAVKELFSFRARACHELTMANYGDWKFEQLAAYGHMGRNDLNVPWERLDKVNELKDAVERIKASGNW